MEQAPSLASSVVLGLLEPLSLGVHSVQTSTFPPPPFPQGSYSVTEEISGSIPNILSSFAPNYTYSRETQNDDGGYALQINVFDAQLVLPAFM